MLEPVDHLEFHAFINVEAILAAAIAPNAALSAAKLAVTDLPPNDKVNES